MSIRIVKSSQFGKIVKQAGRNKRAVHRGSSSICWVLVRDLAIDMHFFGVIGFLWMKYTSYDGP